MTVHQLPARDVATQPCPEGHLTAAEVVHDTEITYRQLDYWTRTGHLHAVSGGPGPGLLRFYPAEQLHRAATTKWLLDAGLAMQVVREVLDELLEVGHVRLAPGLVVALPEDI